MARLLYVLAILAIMKPVVAQEKDVEFGSGAFVLAAGTEFMCKSFGFTNAFTLAELPNAHVQTAIFNNDTQLTHEAAVSWVEQLTVSGFTACIETAGPMTTTRTVLVQWMSYSGSPSTGKANTINVPLFTTGTECVDVDFPANSFTSVPKVYVTAVHSSSFKNSHDALSVWAEGATKFSFKACMRELKSFDGIHENIKIDWLALAGVPSDWSVPFGQSYTMANTATLDSTTKYSFCEDVTFSSDFYAPPVMITSALHTYDSNNHKSINPDNNAITEWIESVSIKGFKVCMKDIQPFEGHHDPVKIEYLALGNLDPCIGVSCKFYATCKAFGPKDARCTCPTNCEDYEDQRCGDDGVTYRNQCELEKAICNQEKTIDVVHSGPCFPFILHRGRAQIMLDTETVRCKAIIFTTPKFLVQYKVHIQATVNYYDSDANSTFIHDAAVAWVENINTANFTACALKTGRNDRVTPDGGSTYIDYIAYQGSPSGAVAGEQVLGNWWDGTTCTLVTLPPTKFSSSPDVIASAQHGVLGQRHDAATTWVEDVTTTSFKLCLRELQNFDGLHEQVKVNWMAYKTLPAELNSERRGISFPNDYAPDPNHNNAFCKDMDFNKAYSAAPTVIVTPAHNSANSAGMLPDHNSIAAWVEHIGSTSARICIKELHSPNGYDPVLLTAMIIGT